MQMANPFGGDELERMQLQAQQTREYADGVKELTRRIEDLNAQQELAPTDARAIEIQGVQSLLSKYRELTPAIQEAQMQQLQFNQTMEKLQPVVSALAGGISSAITGLIDGTKSVEEAFADMFSNIAKAFLDMAAQMLAQEAVFAILKAFGGGSTGVPGGRGPGFYGPAFAGGGYTGDAPRVGGVDGKGGFPAILHPQETVIDHSQGQTIDSAYADARASMRTSNETVQAKTQDKNEEQVYAALQQSATQDVNVRYESTIINEEKYVTEQQFQQGISIGIKQARSQTLKQLRNRPAVRGKAGIS
jgi:hypothetical protein